MTIHPIHTEAGHAAALARIEAPWQAQPGTPAHDELEVLGILVAAYEDSHWPILPPDPVDAIKLHMEQNGLRQTNLAGVLGSAGCSSEILHRRRTLTVEMIRAVHKVWAIPLDILIGSGAGERAA
jgi:HTH-type transcriptional regulator/antitoxin HigA